MEGCGLNWVRVYGARSDYAKVMREPVRVLECGGKWWPSARTATPLSHARRSWKFPAVSTAPKRCRRCRSATAVHDPLGLAEASLSPPFFLLPRKTRTTRKVSSDNSVFPFVWFVSFVVNSRCGPGWVEIKNPPAANGRRVGKPISITDTPSGRIPWAWWHPLAT